MKIKSDQKLSFVPVCELDTFPNCRSWIWWKKFGKKRVQLRLQQAFWTKVAVTIQDITQTLTPPSWCRETLRSSPKAPDTTFYPDQVSQTFLSFFYFPLIQWSIQYIQTCLDAYLEIGKKLESMEMGLFYCSLLFSPERFSHLFLFQSDVTSQWCRTRIYHTI